MTTHPLHRVSQLKFLLLPIRDWNLDVIFLVSEVVCWNFSYSLLGIETQTNKSKGGEDTLKFLLLPIRDWNDSRHSRNFCGRWLKFLLLPIRDWNDTNTGDTIRFFGLKFLLLPIRDWNKHRCIEIIPEMKLKFLLLPIRDWNNNFSGILTGVTSWNFSYSLLGIETST